MSAKPVLFILPGLLCDETCFTHQKAGLSDALDVRSPHFRGFDSMATMAAHVLADAPERFMLAGFSMGGRVALEIMAQMMRAGTPERVQKLCLFDTGATPEPADGAQKRQPLVDLAYAKGMDALTDVWLPPMLGPSRRDDSAFKAAIYEMIRRSSPADHEKQIHALVTRLDYQQLLPKIACPTLVVCGADDAWSTPEHHRAMAAAIPGAQLEIIPDAGHFVSMEQPEAFTRALRKFFAG